MGKKIISEVDDIVNSPSTKWYAQQGTGGALTKSGKAATWVHGKSGMECKSGLFISQQKEGLSLHFPIVALFHAYQEQNNGYSYWHQV
ncbi:hypothetical protein [Salmonella bongori]|uniref:hypothetical protein n=1 Tax=Salmonella bongori TaxID=54736 RepID=UPI00277B5760|nr:hypothetical protein [Salmonella bongori]